MGSTWGNKLKLSIFGESHGPAIGVVIDGLPAGIPIDYEYIAREMARRAPGQSNISTPRAEADQVEWQSGIFNGCTTGAPVCGIIQNTNTRSKDYENKVRPGHADFTAYYKYKGFADYRGGGHFSGRLTAPLVFAGAIAKQILQTYNIVIAAKIQSIGGIYDTKTNPEDFYTVSQKPFPVQDESAANEMKAAILTAKSDGDSVGGIIECVALQVPIGLGSPIFESLESKIAALLFSIPAVKAVEFGSGFALADMRGSEANDPLSMQSQNKTPAFVTNHNGGINGGISNGAPILVRAGIKPTPTILKPQQSVDLTTMQDIVITGKGRHDPCIVPRAVPVIESGLALCILDELL